MPTNADPLAPYLIAEALLQCAEDQLEATWAEYPELVPTDPNGSGEPFPVPGRSCVIAGAIAWDDCECGQLLITLNSQWGSNQFPNPLPDEQHPKCGAPIHVLEYVVSMLRCAPVGEGEQPPTCEALTEAARIAIIDAWAIRTGITCCLVAMNTRTNGVREITHFSVHEQPIDGPEGACMGSALRVRVGINSGCLCPDEGS